MSLVMLNPSDDRTAAVDGGEVTLASARGAGVGVQDVEDDVVLANDHNNGVAGRLPRTGAFSVGVVAGASTYHFRVPRQHPHGGRTTDNLHAGATTMSSAALAAAD